MRARASRLWVSESFLHGPDLARESEARVERVRLRRVNIRGTAELFLFEMRGSERVQLFRVVLCAGAWS